MPVGVSREIDRHDFLNYFFELSILEQASFTELPSSRVESLNISSPSRLNTATLLRCANNPFPPSWSSVKTKSAFPRLSVTVNSGHRWFMVLIISAVCGRAPPENELLAPHPFLFPPPPPAPRVSQDWLSVTRLELCHRWARKLWLLEQFLA